MYKTIDLGLYALLLIDSPLLIMAAPGWPQYIRFQVLSLHPNTLAFGLYRYVVALTTHAAQSSFAQLHRAAFLSTLAPLDLYVRAELRDFAGSGWILQGRLTAGYCRERAVKRQVRWLAAVFFGRLELLR